MTRFTLLLLLLIAGCKHSMTTSAELEKHSFDQAVINKLPLYDSIRQILLDNYDSISFTATGGDFLYNYYGDSGESRYIPKQYENRIFELCNKIGKDNITNFTLTGDSLLTFTIRNERVTMHDPTETITENLYWLSNESKRYSLQNGVMTRDTINTVAKDTMLGHDWKYEISHWKRGGF